MKPTPGTPAQRGFRMPAEWAPHRATWIAWPHETRDWPGRFAPIPWAYCEFVRALSPHETVCILVQNSALQHRAQAMLKRAGVDLAHVQFHRIHTDRVWTRDSGAIFVTDRQHRRLATCWRFNGWAKYPNHRQDARVASTMARLTGTESFSVQWQGRDIVMEGGAIDVDGEGTLMCTEECLLSDVQARNPGLDRRDLEQVFADALGIRRVLWLGRGIAGDDTHGHVDDLARFVAPGRVLLCQEPNGKDPNHAPLQENLERLEGEKVEVVPLPMPAPLVFEGQRLPASYANFYIGNDVVLMPTFNDPQDRVALGILADCFPGRRVIGIHCVEWVWGLGTLHCATQQEPAGTTTD